MSIACFVLREGAYLSGSIMPSRNTFHDLFLPALHPNGTKHLSYTLEKPTTERALVGLLGRIGQLHPEQILERFLRYQQRGISESVSQGGPPCFDALLERSISHSAVAIHQLLGRHSNKTTDLITT